MTETDATNRPINMPDHYIPYMDKYRIYKLLKDMVRELVIALPRDHLCFMKVFLNRNINSGTGTPRIIILVHPDLSQAIDTQRVVKELLKDFGVFIMTRRYIIDRYEKHDDYKPGCLSPEMMSEVTRLLTLKEPVPQVGWLMFDHPCTVREARCLQQDGVLPTVTLALQPAEAAAGSTLTPARSFFDQDFEGLKYVYKATVKEIFIGEGEEPARVAQRCLLGIRAMEAGLQGAGQGHAVLGAPGVYRVAVIGPRGSGRSTQAQGLADHFGLVYLHFKEVFAEAVQGSDEIGRRLRRDGVSVQLRADIVKRRLLKKDCIDHGWVLIGYPASGLDFEYMDNMPTPPNRIVFLSCDAATCKSRLLARGVDPCTGAPTAAGTAGAGQRVLRLQRDAEEIIDAELDTYFTEALGEMRAAAGLTAIQIKANDPIDTVAVRVQAAVMAAPAYDMEYSLPRRDVTDNE